MGGRVCTFRCSWSASRSDLIAMSTAVRAHLVSLQTDKVIPTPPYVHLHVTLVITDSSMPRPEYFGLASGDVVPRVILTTYESMRRASSSKPSAKTNANANLKSESGSVSRSPSVKDATATPSPSSWLWSWWSWWAGASDVWTPHQGLRSGGRAALFVNQSKTHLKLEFNSLNYLAALPGLDRDGAAEARAQTQTQTQEHLVKIFSADGLDDAKLEEIFGKGHVKWTLRKEWDAYPSTFSLSVSIFPACSLARSLEESLAVRAVSSRRSPKHAREERSSTLLKPNSATLHSEL